MENTPIPMTRYEILNLIIQGFIAVGTISVAILAVWGEWVRYQLIGPKLSIHLLDAEGTLTKLTDGTPGRYYKIKVENIRQWAPAKNVRVILTRLSKPAADGTFLPQAFSGPLQLTWQWVFPQYPTVGPAEVCTFGSLIQGKRFTLSPYVTPNNFTGYLDPNQRMLIEVKAVADNGESKPLNIEIAWDGCWSDDARTMQSHLVVKVLTDSGRS
jgi:hypothetical protein